MKRQKTNVVHVSKQPEEGRRKLPVAACQRRQGDEWRVAREERRKNGSEDPPLQKRIEILRFAQDDASGESGVEPPFAHAHDKPHSKAKATTSKRGKEIDAKLVWMQLEDQAAPRLGLSVNERVVYYHLLRHSRLEGKLRLRFSIRWLARNVRLSTGPVREAVRRLIAQGALRLVQRSKAGHIVEVRVPEEIPVEKPNPIDSRADAGEDGQGISAAMNIEEADFMQNAALRQAIHAREGGKCFYCLRRTSTAVQCLDHVVPLAESGGNSYRNLVSCCLECNSQKGEKPAHDFLRWLYREGHLNSSELAGRTRALDDLVSGNLLPVVQPAH